MKPAGYFLILVALLLGGRAAGQEVKMPAQIQVAVGRLGTIPVTSTGKVTRYLSCSPDLEFFREYTDDPKQIQLRVIGYKAGSYKIIAYTALQDMPSMPAVCTVLVGEPPPDPNPPPGPNPPPTPPPDDPLFATLKLAYDREINAAKKKDLASLYRQAAVVTVPDPTFTTVGGLYGVVHNAAEAAVGPAASVLPLTRRAIADELNAKLPRAPATALTPALRQQIIEQFNRIAGLLEKL